MTENTNITYDDKVLKRIIGKAANEVPGVLGPGGGLTGIRDAFTTMDDVDVTQGITACDVDGVVQAEVLITVEENVDMLAVMEQVRQRAGEAVREATGLAIGEIKVEIVDTETKAEYAEKFKDE